MTIVLFVFWWIHGMIIGFVLARITRPNQEQK